jgi:2-oxoacid:acceptor oxidoreductase delta subunit (pyruvate/2-ketoisovalerate family)
MQKVQMKLRTGAVADAGTTVATMTGSWRSYRPVVDMEKCTYCGICETYCPEDIIVIDRKTKTNNKDFAYCKGCGICANECPKECIKMVSEGA